MAEIMIIFPYGYVPTKYPGYFWNTRTNKLSSIKIGGELREIKSQKPNKWNRLAERPGGRGLAGGYRISHKGKRYWLLISDLWELEETHTIFPEMVK